MILIKVQSYWVLLITLTSASTKRRKEDALYEKIYLSSFSIYIIIIIYHKVHLRYILIIMIYTLLYLYRCIRVTRRTSSSIKLKSKYMVYIVNCIVFWKLSRTCKLGVAESNKTFKTQFTSG